jgi:hypothetical protein
MRLHRRGLAFVPGQFMFRARRVCTPVLLSAHHERPDSRGARGRAPPAPAFSSTPERPISRSATDGRVARVAPGLADRALTPRGAKSCRGLSLRSVGGLTRELDAQFRRLVPGNGMNNQAINRPDKDTPRLPNLPGETSNSRSTIGTAPQGADPDGTQQSTGSGDKRGSRRKRSTCKKAKD